MNTLRVPIGPEGPLVDALVGLSATDVQALRKAGLAVPAPVPFQGILDTGAQVTCLDPQVLRQLIAAVNLLPARYVFANVPAAGGLTLGGEYFVGLTIVHPSGGPRASLVLRNHPVLEQPLGALGYQALIGRDVLDLCLLTYDGPGKVATLAY